MSETKTPVNSLQNPTEGRPGGYSRAHAKDQANATASPFARIIWDGMMDEIRNAVLESNREIEQHRKMGRLTKNGLILAQEFKLLSDQYCQKREQLEKIEPSLNQLKKKTEQSVVDDSLLIMLNRALKETGVLREEADSLAERLLKIHAQLGVQIKTDIATEYGLSETLKRCLLHLSPTERGKLDVSVRQKKAGMNIEERIRFLSKLIEQLATNVPAIRHEEVQKLYDEARFMYRQNKYNDTLQTLERLFKFDRKHLLSHRLRAEIFQALNNKVAYLCELRMIVEIDQAEACDFLALAEVLSQNGQHDDALVYYEKAFQKDPSRRSLERMGDICAKKGLWYKAVDAYRLILKKHPGKIEILHKLGHVLVEDKQEEEAMNILRTAIHNDDNHASSRVNLGRLYRQRKESKKAEECFVRALELEPNHPEAHYWLGLLLFDRGDYPQALHHASESVRIVPKRARSLHFLAKCYGAGGQYTQAMEILKPLLSAAIPPVDILLTSSELYRKNGQIQEALAVIENFHKRYPSQPQIRAEYGLLLVDAGRFTEALTYLNPVSVLRTETDSTAGDAGP